MSAASQIPDWVDETPDERTYELLTWEGEEGAASAIQQVALTHLEYIALKKHLAALRGYRIGDLNARVEKLTSQNPAPDAQQTARSIQTAREYYRRCPDLVVFESEELDEQIEELAK